MKKGILLFLMIFFNINFYGQEIGIISSQATLVQDGININLKTYCLTGLNYLGYTYTVNGNQIILSPCYYITLLELPSQFDQNFFIPENQFNSYDIIVNIYSSNSSTTCDYHKIESSTNYPLATVDFNDISNSTKVFPNPTNGLLQIESEHLTINSVKFYNNIGQLVKVTTKPLSNISDLENGTYFMVLNTENGNITKKIILQK